MTDLLLWQTFSSWTAWQRVTSSGSFRSNVPGSEWLGTAVVVGAILLVALSCLCFLLWKRRNAAERERDLQKQQVDELNLKLARLRRMESIGLMAGSIAHDFNNILVGVGGNAELLELSLKSGGLDPEFARERIGAIKFASERARRLAKHMLDHASKQYSAQKVTDLNLIIKDYQLILESYSQKGHRIEFDLAGSEQKSKVDATQVEQAVFNLFTNAIEASPENSVIRIRTFETTLGEEQIQSNPNYFGERKQGGEFCVIEVSDSGCGISLPQLSQIFEPYYSTSAHGRGLGLAVVYGMLVSHNGLIHCESTRGEGTTFQLLFPVSDGLLEDSIDAYFPDVDLTLSSHLMGKSVLIIDDDHAVLDTCQQMIKDFGLRPSTALGGIAGLQQLVSRRDSLPDCLLMDVMMPDKSANQLLSELQQLEIEIPVILMSGFSSREVRFLNERSNVAVILAKPFGIQELKRALIRVLDDRDADVPQATSAKSSIQIKK